MDFLDGKGNAEATAINCPNTKKITFNKETKSFEYEFSNIPNTQGFDEDLSC